MPQIFTRRHDFVIFNVQGNVDTEIIIMYTVCLHALLYKLSVNGLLIRRFFCGNLNIDPKDTLLPFSSRLLQHSILHDVFLF